VCAGTNKEKADEKGMTQERWLVSIIFWTYALNAGMVFR
jgi:hypothetical protein